MKNEIKVMRILSPNDKVINLKEVYEGDSNIYLVMDLAAGGSLYSEMKNRKNLYTRNEVQKVLYNIICLDHDLNSDWINVYALQKCNA